MQSQAKTVNEYLDELPPERAEALRQIRKVIKKNLPKGYAETMQYGMIGYVVPLSLYPKGYLGKPDVPLPYISLASQKNHLAVYLMNIYTADGQPNKEFVRRYKESGKKLDMGKSCVRFKKLEDLPLDVIGWAAGLVPVQKFIQQYEQNRP